MARIKGLGIESIRRIVRRRGRYFEELVLGKVTEDQRQLYRKITTAEWSELTEKPEGTVLYEASKMLFPKSPKPLTEMGRAMALDFLPVLYKILIPIPSVTTVFSHAPGFWPRFADTGRMTQENIQKHSFDLILYDFPDLPAYLLDFYEGYYQGIGELSRAKNFRITRDASNPQAWRWHIDWE